MAKQEKQMENSIDLDYRPNNYFWANQMGVQLSTQIKGSQRKALHEASVAEGEISEFDEFLSKPVLSSFERAVIGRLHPSLMGGEYLPDKVKGEVEIARITLNSTTQDVISLCARSRKNGIFYRIVDEYDGETFTGKSTTLRKAPLTLGEMTNFFLGAWSLSDVLEMNFGDRVREDDIDLDDVRYFILDASSSFYAQFGPLIYLKVDEWLADQSKR